MAIKYEKIEERPVTILEEVNLQVAYETKQVSMKRIILTWGFYILTNALAIVMCLLVSAFAILALCDVFLLAENLLHILSFVQAYPLVTSVMAVIVLAVAVRMVAKHTMRTETIDVERGVEYI